MKNMDEKVIRLLDLERKIGIEKGRKQGAVDFGFWLVNAPSKEIHSKKWIEQKYEQYLKELKELKEGMKNE